MSPPILCIHLLKIPGHLLGLFSAFPASSGGPGGLHELAEVDALAFLTGVLRYALTFALFLFERALGF